jgi:trehalose synthase
MAAPRTPEPALSVREVDVAVHSLSRFEPLIGTKRYDELNRAAADARHRLDGQTVWNLSSTATGGGVAEMLQVLVGYIQDTGIDIRWLVMTGDAEFFTVTKRIHNRLHGVAGDDGDLGPDEAQHYQRITDSNVASALDQIRPGDVVLLHDPQTAGMAASLVAAGALVVWRCHVGREGTNQWTDQAWSFLRPHLTPCAGYIFSLARYVPSWMEGSRVRVIPPSIDPFSPKNQDMPTEQVHRTLRQIGLFGRTDDTSAATFTRRDGTTGRVERQASIVSDGTPLAPDVPLVIQVSRWDHLKDMQGVLKGFADVVLESTDAQLALVGPSVADVTDDPEGAEVFAECLAAWERLPEHGRGRVGRVTHPMDDVDENAAMVNAIQRHATVVVQKSLMEGFGLTVAEGMWKSRALIASRVGGIVQQITPGTGILLDDPTELTVFGQALTGLLLEPDEIVRLGESARRHVLENFVGDKHLLRYAELIEWLVSESAEASGT